MKTANRIVTLFNESTINGRICLQIGDLRSSETATGYIFRKLLNHHQYNIPNTTISIVVAKGVEHSKTSRKSFLYNDPGNEGGLLPILYQDQEEQLIFRVDDYDCIDRAAVKKNKRQYQ
jgi:hypothetical protein